MRNRFFGFVAAFGIAAIAIAAEPAKTPAPAKELQWLKQLEGEWETNAEAIMEKDKPPVTCKGIETTRSLGGFWTVSEYKGSFFDLPMTGLMTVGFDEKKKKYIGTWVCSMDGYLFQYLGSLDEKTNTLTLETEGPSPSDPTKIVKMKDVLQVKDKDHKTLTSFIEMDGKWVQFMTMSCTRKK